MLGARLLGEPVGRSAGFNYQPDESRSRVDLLSFLRQFQAESIRKMKIRGAHVAAARELLKLSQGELAKVASVGLQTVVRFETGAAEPYASSLEKIQSELERRGIEFTNGDGVGVRLNYAKAAEFARAEALARKESEG